MILAVLLIAALVAGCGKQEAPASNGSTDSEGRRSWRITG